MWTVLLLISLAIFGLAYLFYEPFPEGLNVPLKSRVVLAVVKTADYMSSGLTYFGYSKGSTMRAMVNVLSYSSNKTEDPSITVTDSKFNGVNVRIYTPKGSTTELRRGIVYYHGGGFVMGSLDIYHRLTLQISKVLNAVVISVDYRLAPEHIFPAAIDDCEKATLYFIQHAEEFEVDPKRIAVWGDSAGANLAAAVSIRLRNQEIQPKLQILVEPPLQFINFDTPSYSANSRGPLLTKTMAVFYAANYMLGDEGTTLLYQFYKNNHMSVIKKSNTEAYMDIDVLPKDHILKNYKPQTKGGDERVWEKIKNVALNSSLSPLLEHDLSGLPQTYISTCQNDVFRDDGFFYAKRLKEAGVAVVHDNVEQCYHGMMLSFSKIIKFIDSKL